VARFVHGYLGKAGDPFVEEICHERYLEKRDHVVPRRASFIHRVIHLGTHGMRLTIKAFSNNA